MARCLGAVVLFYCLRVGWRIKGRWLNEFAGRSCGAPLRSTYRSRAQAARRQSRSKNESRHQEQRWRGEPRHSILGRLGLAVGCLRFSMRPAPSPKRGGGCEGEQQDVRQQDPSSDHLCRCCLCYASSCGRKCWPSHEPAAAAPAAAANNHEQACDVRLVWGDVTAAQKGRPESGS